ncbi:hypothetical protein FQN51_001043 [Onygenales sp. PD_10]|nr:hypothetical protein FQN51_001043 [Onygenales sp. PD_10]
MGKYSESPAWNRYFVSDKTANPANGWNANEESEDAFLNIPTDNYAWFFNYNWFHHKWSWDADGSQPLKQRMIERDEGIGKPNILNEPVNPVEEGDLVLGQSTIPANCHIEDGDVESAVCNYAGEGYDVFIDRLDEPFEARNSECILS